MIQENNWKECFTNLINNSNLAGETSLIKDRIIELGLMFGNFVFESTKKECAKRIIMDDSLEENQQELLNIQKPNV